jgi:cytochrome c
VPHRLAWFIACAVSLQFSGAIGAGAPPGPAGDAARGEQVYARCMACHALTENRIGPRHCGVFGRRAGAVRGFDYSPAMRGSTIVWNEKSLDAFITDPMKYVPGTSMVFAGVPDPQERADVIAWLKSSIAHSAACAPPVKRPDRR